MDTVKYSDEGGGLGVNRWSFGYAGIGAMFANECGFVVILLISVSRAFHW